MAAPRTGNGATLAFATSVFTFDIKSLSGYEEEVPVLDDSVLSSSDVEKIAGDLMDRTSWTVEGRWDPDSRPPVGADPETITLTFPLGQGQATATILAGTGFISKRSYPSIENNSLLDGSYEFVWDGKTGPTLTASTLPPP